MNVDWIVSFVIFILFISWAFAHFTGFFTYSAEPMENVISHIEDKIHDFLSIETYSIPTEIDSSEETNNSVLYITYYWPFGKNVSRIFLENSSLPCQIVGDKLYWQANLTPGANYFTLKFSNKTGDVNCSSSFTIENETHAHLHAEEEQEMISQSRINQLLSTDYETFKQDLGIRRNFRIEFNESGQKTYYGPELPGSTNVYVTEKLNLIEETISKIQIRIMVW